MDDALLRQRRNLLSISFVLLLFILGGGDVESLFGVKLDHGYVAEVFACVGFLYFWWRFCVFGGNQVKEKYFEDCLIVAKKDKILFERVKAISNGTNLVEYFKDVERVDNKIEGFSASIDEENTGQRVLKYRLMNHTGNQITAYRNLTLSVSVSKEIMHACLKDAVFKGTVVSDYLLPHMLAGLVLTIGVYNYSDYILVPIFQFILT